MTKSFCPIWLVAILSFSIAVVACSDDASDNDSSPVNQNQVDDDAGFDSDADDLDSGADAETDGGNDRPSPDGGNEWDWDDEFYLQAISPARGPLAGGTTVQISGSGFGADTVVLLGDQPLEVTLSQGQLIGQTPPTEVAGPVTVRVMTGDGDVATIQNGFTYSDGLQVDSLSPTRLPTTGGVEITLTGRGFVEEMGVSFSGVGARRIDVLSSQMARVIVPAHPRGAATLRVSIPDEAVTLEEAVHFFVPLRITTVLPGVGSTAGGDSLVLTGQGLTTEMEVFFDDEPATVNSVDVAGGLLEVTAPPATEEGPVDIVVTTEDDSFRLRDGYTYDDGTDDDLFSIFPATAPITGGTSHVVAGRGLDASNSEIYLGDQPAIIEDAGPGFAIILAPAAATPGPVDLSLSRSGTPVALLEEALSYEGLPSISDVVPNAGPASGGSTVVITGQGFSDVDSIRFGTIPAAFTVDSDDQITVVTPRAEAGKVDIIIASGSQQALASDAFRFETDLSIWSMRPSRGAIAGGTFVTLQGHGFEGLIEVLVDQESATEIRRLDPYTVTFRTPPSSTGPKNVEVFAAASPGADAPYPFVYFNPMSSFGGASGGPIDGSVNVTVVTNSGAPIPGAFVMLSTRSDAPYQGITDANGQLTLSGPDVLGAQNITATAANFATFTARHLDAQNITIILTPTAAEGGGGAGTPPPMGRISGEISISGKNDDPAGGVEYNMAVVRTTRNDIRSGMMNPGPDATTAGEGAYSITTRIGDMALIALCGHHDEATDVFTPALMGVARYLFVADGDHLQVDLDCDIPLDQSLAVKLVDPVYAPDGPDTNEVRAYLDFGFEGVFPLPDYARGLADVLVVDGLPAAEGRIEDLSYSVMAGSYRGAGVPYTQTILEEITDLSSLHATAPLVAVPELLEPAPGAIIDGELRLGLKGSNEPDLFYIILRSPIGIPLWTLVVPGYETTIPFPEFPDFDMLPADARPEPYVSGLAYGVVYAIRIDNFDFHGFTNRDFSTARWSAFAVDTWSVQLAP